MEKASIHDGDHRCEPSTQPCADLENNLEIRDSTEEARSRCIKVLCLPSYHPYTKRFDDGNDIRFVNPDCDFFANSNTATPEFLETNFPPEEYDVVHFHFEHYLISSEQLRMLVAYFKNKRKPIVWTCHDRKNLLADSDDSSSERTLFENADEVTTLTHGCARWLEMSFGTNKKIHVIPHGYIVHPSIVQQESEVIRKDPDLFTIHIGDFRKSKDFIPAIEQFLGCPSLDGAKLQLIYRDIDPALMDIESARRNAELQQMIRNSRIETICMKDIPDMVMVHAFLRSHAIILPYCWGTHSGQLELARDCGCHVAATDVGFYTEQWEDAKTWSRDAGKKESASYTDILTNIHRLPSLEPAGLSRAVEFANILAEHKRIYQSLIKQK